MKKIGLILTLVLMNSGCTNALKNIRNDVDYSVPVNDEPTHGGIYPVGGQINDDDLYVPSDYSGRGPASQPGPSYGNESWITGAHAAANQRDFYRQGGQYSGRQAISYDDAPSVRPPVRRRYENGNRATREDFIDKRQNEGSLWASSGQTNYYFTENKVKSAGDIVTLEIEQKMVGDVQAEVLRTLSPMERDMELKIAQAKIRAAYLGLPDPSADQVKTGQSGPQRTPAGANQSAASNDKKEDVDEDKIPKATMNDVDISKAVNVEAGEKLLGEVVERYPNGNYKVRATKRIMYRGKARLLTLIAVAQGDDVESNQDIKTGKLYEYRLNILR